MTFVKVKDHEWLDLNRKIYLGIEEIGGKVCLGVDFCTPGERQRAFFFPTLAEALTAAEKIIESCEATTPVGGSDYKSVKWGDSTEVESTSSGLFGSSSYKIK